MFIEERKKLGLKSDEFNKKVEDLKTMLAGNNGNANSNYFVYKWALWIRRGFGVPRCSNYNESLRGVINRAFGQ